MLYIAEGLELLSEQIKGYAKERYPSLIPDNKRDEKSIELIGDNPLLVLKGGQWIPLDKLQLNKIAMSAIKKIQKKKPKGWRAMIESILKYCDTFEGPLNMHK